MMKSNGNVSISGANYNPAFAEDPPNLCRNHNCVRRVAVNAESIALQSKPRTIDRDNVSGFDY